MGQPVHLTTEEITEIKNLYFSGWKVTDICKRLSISQDRFYGMFNKYIENYHI